MNEVLPQQRDPRMLSNQGRHERPPSYSETSGENLLRESDKTFGLEPTFIRYLNSLTELNNDQTPEIVERMEAERTKFFLTAIGVSQGELDEFALRFKNMIPYGEGSGNRFFNEHSELMKQWARESEVLIPELQKEVAQAYADLEWIRSNRDIIRGLGPVLEGFYDGNAMYGTVMRPNRRDPTVDDFANTFSRYATYIDKDLLIKDVPPLSDKERITLHELGVEFHTQNIFWTNASIGAAQLDYDDDYRRSMGFEDHEGGWHEGLTNEQLLFTQMVFGAGANGEWSDYDKDKWVKYGDNLFPNKVLSWQSMASTSPNKKIYIAVKEALLLRRATEELKKPEYQETDPNHVQNLAILAAEIKKTAKDIINRQNKLFIPQKGDKDERDSLLKETLARYVACSEIAMQWGFMSAIHDNWAWVYEVNEKDGRVSREKTSGWIGTATDSGTFVALIDYMRGNVAKGWPGLVWPEADSDYLKMLDDRRTGYKPQLKDLTPNAGITQGEIDKGELDSKSFQRLKNRIQSLNPEAWKVLQRMIWYQETPHKNKNGKNIVLPIWVPPVIESVNFLDTIPWKTNSAVKLKLGGKKPLEEVMTLRQALRVGHEIGDYDWGALREDTRIIDHRYYYHLISLGQLAKFTLAMSQNNNADVKPLAAILNDSSMAQELQKRGNLASREEKIPYALNNAVLFPVLIMETVVRMKHKLFDEKTINDKEYINLAIADSLQPWKTMIQETFPDEKDGVKNYRELCLALFDFYTTMYIEMSIAYSNSKQNTERKTEAELVAVVNEDLGVNYSAKSTSKNEPSLTK